MTKTRRNSTVNARIRHYRNDNAIKGGVEGRGKGGSSGGSDGISKQSLDVGNEYDINGRTISV